jgi:O-antigen/teichoic acid export membrane protein
MTGVQSEAGMAPPAETTGRLGRRALSLGVANAYDYAMQLLLPVVLVRCLEADAFGGYRLLWLAVGTVMSLAPLAMPQSLYYFLPGADRAGRRLYINQTLLFLAGAGFLAAWAVSGWNPWLPQKLHALAGHDIIVPAFLFLWLTASLLDMLPTVEERIAWQARATIGLSTLRALALSATALATQELAPVLAVLLVFAAFKVTLLLGYVARYHGLRGPLLRGGAFADQVRHAAPFGFSSALYGLRSQADQWIAAALFSLGSFAAFSIAAVLTPVVHLFRQSVNHAFLPSMSRLQAAGDLPGMLQLNSRANVLVAVLVYPLLAFAFTFAEELVTVVYTAAYVEAAPVMRVYIIAIAALTVELAGIMLLLREGVFALRLNVFALVLSVGLSWVAAQRYGLPGAALGSVLAVYVDRIVTLQRIALRTGMPLARLQNWRVLGVLLLFAALAALPAWFMVRHYFSANGALVHLAVGGAVLAATYAALLACTGMSGGGLITARQPVR